MAARNWVGELTGPVAWSAVVGGVFVALVVHILLNLLGAGIGASSMEVRTPTQGEGQAIGWGAFAWWSISGIIAAFAGGWAAGLLAAGAGSPNGALHGFLSWAVTTVVVITGAAIATGTAAAALGAMFAPIPTFIERPQETSEAAQSAVAIFSLASFVALLIGAGAATWGGRLAYARTTQARARK
jgi:hypothetical protein